MTGISTVRKSQNGSRKIFVDTRNTDDVWILHPEYLILTDCFSFLNCSAKFDHHLKVQYDDLVAKNLRVLRQLETGGFAQYSMICSRERPTAAIMGGCKTELSGLKKAAQGMGLCERGMGRGRERRGVVGDSKLKF